MKKSYLGYHDKGAMLLFLNCWLVYFSTYICRLNFSVVTPELTKNNIMHEEQIAAVSSAFFICYGAGQLISGWLGDKFSPRILVFSGTFISAFSNILIFFLSYSPSALVLLWGINGAVQSLVWSPILRLAGDCLNSRDKEKFGTDISTTVALGTLASYGISFLTMLFLPWRFTFLSCGICTLTASLIWITQTAKLNLSKNKGNAGENQKRRSISVQAFMKLLIISGCLILMLPIAIQGTLKDSVTQWAPAFFDSSFNTGTSISILLTMVLTVVNVSGAYISRAINKRIKNEMTTSAIFFAVAFAFLLIMICIGAKNAVTALLCTAVITTCMHAINVMFITMVPLYFSRYNCTSTMGGLLNAVAYIGCGALNIAAGRILSVSSWNRLFIFWLIICVIAIALSLVCAVVWKKFKSSPPPKGDHEL